MKKIKNVFKILGETGEGIFFTIMFLALTIFTLVLFYDLFFRVELFNQSARSTLLLSFSFNTIVLIYFYYKILNVIFSHNNFISLEEIQKNQKLINRLTIDNANVILLHCIRVEEYELARLIEQRIKKLNLKTIVK